MTRRTQKTNTGNNTSTAYGGAWRPTTGGARVKSPALYTPNNKTTYATPSHSNTLTNQERHIAILVAAGNTNTDIANTLYLTHGTVKNYVSAILDKLHLNNRAALAAYAIQHNLQSHEPNREQETPTDPDCYKDFIFLAYA